MDLLIKFQSESERVKFVSFHPTRPLIIAALHDGEIQLWDYELKILLTKFKKHEGAVRGIDFHPTQPLFVSAGNDSLISIWNYKERKHLYYLEGHTDYIRTVQFHKEFPWILSCSDDQTIRIWNWQNRTCISVLTGHNHFVMYAAFHPNQDLILSASLDNTIRIWDFSGLRLKYSSLENQSDFSIGANTLSQLQKNLFGNSEVELKFILEDHEQGVNWASFHPRLPLIVSCSDDRTLKLWKISDSQVILLETLTGHRNNVCAAIFHPKEDLILSDSEDSTLRIWSLDKKINIKTFSKDDNSFWCLANHPTESLFAAGHDKGFILFKLSKERPAYFPLERNILFVKNNSIMNYNIKDHSQNIVSKSSQKIDQKNLFGLHYNKYEKLMLLEFNDNFELIRLSTNETNRSHRGSGGSCIWISRDKIGVLSQDNKILLKNLQNQITKTISLPDDISTNTPKEITHNLGKITRIFAAGFGMILLRTVSKIYLLDIQQKKILSSISAKRIKQTIWSEDMNYLALIGAFEIIICDKKLKQIATIEEKIRIKGYCWSKSNVFFYTTLHHFKYCLSNGDYGIIKSIDKCIYLVAVDNNAAFYFDRIDDGIRIMLFDSTEVALKSAIINNKMEDVVPLLRNKTITSRAFIEYLTKHGHPEIALHFVQNEKTKFELALQCGDIQNALDSAKKIDHRIYWQNLAKEALKQGNVDIVENCHLRNENIYGLIFLYSITGNFDKLSKLPKIAEMKDDLLSHFQAALFLGSPEERIKTLVKSNQLNYAYLTAKTYGLTEEAEKIQALIEQKNKNVPDQFEPKSKELITTPTPILHQTNWPLLTVSRGITYSTFAKDNVIEDDKPQENIVIEGEWDIPELEESKTENQIQTNEPQENEENDWIDGNEIDLLEITENIDKSIDSSQKSEKEIFVAPIHGKMSHESWIGSSNIPAEYVAAGHFKTAMDLLNSQIGIVNFNPMKNLFLSLFLSAHDSLQAFPNIIDINYENCDQITKKTFSSPFTIQKMKKLIQEALNLTTSGKFLESMKIFELILVQIPLMILNDPSEVNEVKKMIVLSKEYLSGLKLEQKRKELQNNPKRSLEMSCYFTHCNLQLNHLILSLRSAMLLSLKEKNHINALSFAKRILELGASKDLSDKARKVVVYCEKNQSNAYQLNYDERNPFVLCCYSFEPIYRGNDSVDCPYCGASYLPKYSNQLCNICQMSKIGIKDLKGLTLLKKI
ncbi:coatomer subunit alpha [Anaeramoeba ignava]|uniref:Coatomer subunit alpha n=1 Tax=Anaeramoeba ignava TaxID=1746090 RepID=A0A9Q0RGQ7_ANAIG|nr:coatomer subunit alpha [Anaeramoeba ignava]